MLVSDHLGIHFGLVLENVLILVLVDVGLGHYSSGEPVWVYESLNPCFSGCWSRTRRQHCCGRLLKTVS